MNKVYMSHATFFVAVAAYIQYCIYKCAPLVIFGPPAAKSWGRAWCEGCFQRMSPNFCPFARNIMRQTSPYKFSVVLVPHQLSQIKTQSYQKEFVDFIYCIVCSFNVLFMTY